MKNFGYIVRYIDSQDINRYIKIFAMSKNEAIIKALDNCKQVKLENIIKVESI